MYQCKTCEHIFHEMAFLKWENSCPCCGCTEVKKIKIMKYNDFLNKEVEQ